MKLHDATVLVTGASRGLGREFARQCRDAGAAKVYATARHPDQIDLDGVHRLTLDVTDEASVARAADLAPDVDVLINNAGIATAQTLLTGELDLIHAEMDTHFYGTLSVLRRFAPILARNGGGAVLNVLSVLSFRAIPGHGAYAAAKAAQWSLTNSARLELAGQGTQVTALHLASAETDMMPDWPAPRADPADVVATALTGLIAGTEEVLADDETRWVKEHLADAPETLYPGVASPSRRSVHGRR